MLVRIGMRVRVGTEDRVLIKARVRSRQRLWW